MVETTESRDAQIVGIAKVLPGDEMATTEAGTPITVVVWLGDRFHMAAALYDAGLRSTSRDSEVREAALSVVAAFESFGAEYVGLPVLITNLAAILDRSSEAAPTPLTAERAVGTRPYRYMLDGSACWCESTMEPHDGWVHAPFCTDRRMLWEIAQENAGRVESAARRLVDPHVTDTCRADHERDLRAALASEAAPVVGLSEAERIAIRIEVETEAMQTVARIVHAAGGEVRVPDLYDKLDWSVTRDPVDNATVWRARLTQTRTLGEAE